MDASRGFCETAGGSRNFVPAIARIKSGHDEKGAYQTLFWRLLEMIPVLTPLQASSPWRREYSILGQRFITTLRPAASARAAASALRTPICIHTTLAPIAIASSVIGPAAAELRKMSTMSK